MIHANPARVTWLLTEEGAVVPTETITVWGVAAETGTDEDDRVQAGAGVTTGVTAQARATVPENEPMALRGILNVAVTPEPMV